MNYRIGEYSIIGAGGRAVDPRDFEADAVIGALEGMPDDVVIGQGSGLMLSMPGLQDRAAASGSNRIASLLAASRRGAGLGYNMMPAHPMGMGAGAAAAYAPAVVPSSPGPVGLALIPFQIASVAAGATSAPIIVTPQSIFKPYKLVCDPVIAPFFLITLFTNGTVPFFDAPGAVSAAMFTSDGLPNLKKITSNPGISITLVVQNRDVVAHPFLAALYGEAAPTQCG